MGARTAGRAALTAWIGVLAGCAGAPGAPTNPMDRAARAAEEIEILVRNLNFSQATVYTSRDGGSRRLGIVPGKGEATFRAQWRLPHIQLRVRFLAGRDFVTERIAVGPGETLELIVPSRF